MLPQEYYYYYFIGNFLISRIENRKSNAHLVFIFPLFDFSDDGRDFVIIALLIILLIGFSKLLIIVRT